MDLIPRSLWSWNMGRVANLGRPDQLLRYLEVILSSAERWV
jgi:hypothetical protein